MIRPRRIGTKLTQERAKPEAESQADIKKRELESRYVFVEITRSLYPLRMAVKRLEKSHDSTRAASVID
jgi:hypothetical protein